MNTLKDYIIYNSETQYDKNTCLYEIYGKTNTGILFERNLENTDEILLHVGDGIKKPQNYLDNESFFFRKSNSESDIFSNYKNYTDFNFESKESISKEYIISIIKRYIYMENPYIGESQPSSDYKEHLGILGNPTLFFGTFLLEDGKKYTITKHYDVVKIFNENEEINSLCNKKEYCSFLLEQDLYSKAINLDNLKRFIFKNTFSKSMINKTKEFISLYKELDEITKIIDIKTSIYKILDKKNNCYLDLTKYCINAFGDVMTINGQVFMNQTDFEVQFK